MLSKLPTLNAPGTVAAHLAERDRSASLQVPVDACVMHGFGRYDEHHPFVKSISDGTEPLTEAYRRHQPSNVAEMYAIKPAGRVGESLPPWRLPWVKDIVPPAGENGLGREHGVSYFGPCTPEKAALEHHRLTSVTRSIRHHGYFADSFLRGCFLARGSQLRFFVRGGKHRAAALTALPFRMARARFKPKWPSVVRRDSMRS